MCSFENLPAVPAWQVGNQNHFGTDYRPTYRPTFYLGKKLDKNRQAAEKHMMVVRLLVTRQNNDYAVFHILSIG